MGTVSTSLDMFVAAITALLLTVAFERFRDALLSIRAAEIHTATVGAHLVSSTGELPGADSVFGAGNSADTLFFVRT